MNIFKELIGKAEALRFCGIDENVLHKHTDTIAMVSYTEDLNSICDEIRILEKLYNAIQMAPKGITFDTNALLETVSKYVGYMLEHHVKPNVNAWAKEGLLTEAQKAAIKSDFDATWEKMMLEFY